MDAPTAMGGDGSTHGRVAHAARPAQQKGRNAGHFGGMLQAARGRRFQPADLAHDAREAAMAQAFLQHERHRERCHHMQHAVRVQAGPGQGRGEEIGLLHGPEHGARETRQDAGRHQPGGTGLDFSGPGIGHFMQAAEAQPAPRQMAVHHVDTERQNGVRSLCPGTAFQPGDLSPDTFNVLKRLSHSSGHGSSELEHNVNNRRLERAE